MKGRRDGGKDAALDDLQRLRLRYGYRMSYWQDVLQRLTLCMDELVDERISCPLARISDDSSPISYHRSPRSTRGPT